MALLEITHLSASYGAGSVLEDISIEVPARSVFGLVGPNGHGKTTLMRAISGMMPQQSGTILLEGKPVNDLAPEVISAKGVVHVPQGDLVYKNMTVLENLLVGGYTNPSDAVTESQLERVFELFPKLRERAAQTASSLSGGERRMLGIGRGLMMARAKLLMLDEPSLGLAPIVIDQIYAAIDQLRRTGLTIIIVEENVGRISSVADRLSMLNHGRIVWTGSPVELRDSSQLLETYLGV